MLSEKPITDSTVDDAPMTTKRQKTSFHVRSTTIDSPKR